MRRALPCRKIDGNIIVLRQCIRLSLQSRTMNFCVHDDDTGSVKSKHLSAFWL